MSTRFLPRPSIGTKLNFGFAVLVLLVAGLTVSVMITAQLANRQIEMLEQAERTEFVIKQIELAVLEIKQHQVDLLLEYASEGTVVAYGDYLAYISHHREELAELIAELEVIQADDAVFKQKLGVLRILLDDQDASYGAVLDSLQTGDMAQSTVAQRRLAESTNAIENQLEGLIDYEYVVGNDSRAVLQQSMALVEVVNKVVIAIAVICGLGLSVWLTRNITRPIVALKQAADRLAGGDLSVQVPVQRGDEIGSLAVAFNQMAGRQRQALEELEQRVEARTRDLTLAAEIGRVLSQVHDLDVLLAEAARLIHQRFGLYHTQLYLIDEDEGELVFRGGVGPVAQQRQQEGHRMPVDRASVSGRTVLDRETIMMMRDDAAFVPHPLLPETRSEMSIPLLIGERVVGVLNVQSSRVDEVGASNLPAFEALAGQLAIAIENARLLEATQRALHQEKAARAQLVQAEKLASMGRLMASVTHELGNPLQAINSMLFLIHHSGGLDAQARKDVEVVLGEAERMAGLLNQLRDTYRPSGEADFASVSVNALVDEVRQLVATHMRKHGVKCVYDLAGDLPSIDCVRGQIKQVILNMCLNAAEAMADGGELVVSTVYLAADEMVRVRFADSGPGISPELLPNIFDPFFTTKESGTGLGLTIIHEIVQQHGGAIMVESEVNRGTTFDVRLPVWREPVEQVEDDNRQVMGGEGDG